MLRVHPRRSGSLLGVTATLQQGRMSLPQGNDTTATTPPPKPSEPQVMCPEGALVVAGEFVLVTVSSIRLSYRASDLAQWRSRLLGLIS
jgi:hypothetical protein